MAVAVQSGGEELLYISDAALDPLPLEHPDWGMAFDLDPAAALASRRVVFDRAAERSALVLAFHFHPFPSLGRVTRAGTGWRWHPLEVGDGHPSAASRAGVIRSRSAAPSRPLTSEPPKIPTFASSIVSGSL